LCRVPVIARSAATKQGSWIATIARVGGDECEASAATARFRLDRSRETTLGVNPLVKPVSNGGFAIATQSPMHPLDLTTTDFFTGVLAGVLGMFAMQLVMWLITRQGWAKGNMVIALGSLITRKRENAWGVGAIVHVIAAILFAMLYLLVMAKFGFTHLPAALVAGICFGLFHGMIVTLTLVWIVSEQHPLEEFQDAGLAVGVSHIAGHAAYGAVVGLVIGIALS
jgi:hypothetical protein